MSPAVLRPHLAAAVLLIASVALPGQAVAQTTDNLLGAIPAEAQVVSVAPSLDALGAALSTLNTELGLSQPWMADARALPALFGMASGVRMEAPLAAVVTDVMALIGGGGGGLVILLPVSDYATFLSNFGATPGGSVDEVMAMDSMPLHVRSLNGYALIGTDAASVAAYPESVEGGFATLVDGLHDTVVGRGSASLVVNMSRLEPVLAPAVNDMFSLVALSMEMSRAEVPGSPSGAMLEGMFEAYHVFVDSFVRDAAVVSMAFDVVPENLSVESCASFEPGSAWANAIGSGGSVDGLLDGLPAGSPLMVWASNLEGVDLSPVAEYLATREGETGSTGTGNVWLDSFLMMTDIRRFSSVWYAGTEQMQSVTIYEGDGTALREGLQAYISAVDGESLYQVPQADGTSASVSYTSSWERDVSSVGDLAVDRYSMSLNLPPELTADPEMAAMYDPFGMTDISGLIASGPDLLIAVTQLDETALAGALETWRSRDGLGTTMTSLPALRAAMMRPQPMTEGLIDFGALMGSFMGSGATFGSGPTTEPIGFFAWTEPGEVAGQMLLPLSLVRFFQALATMGAGGTF